MAILGKNAFDNAARCQELGQNTCRWQGNLIVTGSITQEGGGGTVTLNGATPVTVSNSNVTANSTILFTLKAVHGTVGAYPSIKTITPGTGFTVAGTALDLSDYNYNIIG